MLHLIRVGLKAKSKKIHSTHQRDRIGFRRGQQPIQSRLHKEIDRISRAVDRVGNGRAGKWPKRPVQVRILRNGATKGDYQAHHNAGGNLQFTKVSSLVSKRTWANFSQASICFGASAPLKSFFASHVCTLPATRPSTYLTVGAQPNVPRPMTRKSIASFFFTSARPIAMGTGVLFAA